MWIWTWTVMILWSMEKPSILIYVVREAQQGSALIFCFFVKAFLIIRNVSLANDLRYTEADVIPCSGNEPRDADERQALRGAVLKYARTQTAHILLVLPITSSILSFLFFAL